MEQNNQNQRNETYSHDVDRINTSPDYPGNNVPNYPSYHEETAAEYTAPIRNIRNDSTADNDNAGVQTGMGWLALALSIISLFIWPVLLGAAGIITGFVARRRGANTLGAWAIGIGIFSLIIGIFIMPFFNTRF